MRKWTVREGVPDELARWRKDVSACLKPQSDETDAQVFTSKEWDELMLRTVVPKLGATLRDDFSINPRKQDMQPLEEWVLPWHTLLRSSTFAQLLQVNFFPKWLDILYIWLVQPNFKPDEVANWYVYFSLIDPLPSPIYLSLSPPGSRKGLEANARFTWWKSRFPEAVLDMPGVAYGFTSGLELMQEAMRLGAEAPHRLKKPAFNPPEASSRAGSAKPTRQPLPASRGDTQTGTEITFRALAEEIASQNDLIFLPLGRSHDRTGKPLFKVCKSVDGRGGITVYVAEDAVFAQTEDGSFKAVSLDDMVKRATGSA